MHTHIYTKTCIHKFEKRDRFMHAFQKIGTQQKGKKSNSDLEKARYQKLA